MEEEKKEPLPLKYFKNASTEFVANMPLLANDNAFLQDISSRSVASWASGSDFTWFMWLTVLICYFPYPFGISLYTHGPPYPYATQTTNHVRAHPSPTGTRLHNLPRHPIQLGQGQADLLRILSPNEGRPPCLHLHLPRDENHCGRVLRHHRRVREPGRGQTWRHVLLSEGFSDHL